MLGIGPILLIVVLGLVFAGFYVWARRQGLTTPEPVSGQGRPAEKPVSLLTEAVAYVGGILVLAGGGVAIGQRWDDIAEWGHVAILGGATVFFLALGLVVRRVREPAVQRLVGVAWFVSVVGVAVTAGVASSEIFDAGDEVTMLAVGLSMTVYAAALWLVRKHALQHAALFAGLVVTVNATILVVAGDPPPSLAFALALWAFGLGWALLAWRRYVEPLWIGVALGVLLGLLGPSFGLGDNGWLYALGIATAVGAMALSVPLRNTPLLALGALAAFGYVTGMVVQYFGDTLGVPATLAITGGVILVLATVSARLARTTHPPEKPNHPVDTQPPGRAA